MKTVAALTLALLAVALSFAEDIKLKDGRVFQDAKIGENSDSERVVILHRGGVATVPVGLLPDRIEITKPSVHRVSDQEETEEGCEIELNDSEKLVCVNYRKLHAVPDRFSVKGALQAEYHQTEKVTGYFIAIYLDRAPGEEPLGLREASDWLGNRYEVKDVTVNGNPGGWRRESGYISVPVSLLEQAKESGGNVKFSGSNSSVVLGFEPKAVSGFLLRCSREFQAAN